MQLFLDCDGVMANFGKLAEEVFGLPLHEAEDKVGTKRFWCDLGAYENFFLKLELMPDALELFEAVKHLNPTILTAVNGKIKEWAEPQKRQWVENHFPATPIICCRSRDKRLHMQPGDVLVDDWLKYKHLWEEAGGIFVHHTSAKESIAKLKELGVL